MQSLASASICIAGSAAVRYEPFGLGYQDGESEVHSADSDPVHDGPLSEEGGFVDWLLERNAGLESCGTNHFYTREEREKLSHCESIDYLPPNSSVYRTWLARQPHR